MSVYDESSLESQRSDFRGKVVLGDNRRIYLLLSTIALVESGDTIIVEEQMMLRGLSELSVTISDSPD